MFTLQSVCMLLLLPSVLLDGHNALDKFVCLYLVLSVTFCVKLCPLTLFQSLRDISHAMHVIDIF